MSRYLPYSPEQVSLLPASVREVLSADHLCFFIHEAIERLDLSGFHEAYEPEGGPLYHPSLMLKVWCYAYALGITSSRRLEQRICEDLAFRFLAGGARPDYWALNAFRRRHGRALNNLLTQVMELAQQQGVRRLGTVAVDSTRVQSAASREKLVKVARQERARVRTQVRRWQQALDRGAARDPERARCARLDTHGR